MINFNLLLALLYYNTFGASVEPVGTSAVCFAKFRLLAEQLLNLRHFCRAGQIRLKRALLSRLPIL